jgi:hypothetical protein
MESRKLDSLVGMPVGVRVCNPFRLASIITIIVIGCIAGCSGESDPNAGSPPEPDPAIACCVLLTTCRDSGPCGKSFARVGHLQQTEDCQALVSGNLAGKREAIAACQAGTGATPNPSAVYGCSKALYACTCSTEISEEASVCSEYDYEPSEAWVCCADTASPSRECSCKGFMCENMSDGSCRCGWGAAQGSLSCSGSTCCMKPGDYCRCSASACTADESKVAYCARETFQCVAGFNTDTECRYSSADAP